VFENEKIYIAGPECFYKGGAPILDAMRRRAESLGFAVTLPNDHPLDMDNEDLRKRADSIFEDLKTVMKETTVVIADLESYRGSEADSGTVYELGMAYADGLKCYGYTRDKRPLVWKDQKYVLSGNIVRDERGKPAPYRELPFAPTVVGSTKIVEGDFDDCLAVLMTDLEEAWKARGRGLAEEPEAAKAVCLEPPQNRRIYLADLNRYEENASEIYSSIKRFFESYGFEAVTPCDLAEGMKQIECANPYERAAALTENYRRLIESCGAVLADLNEYRGFECANDVGFECGMGFEMGKALFGYMDDVRPCIEKIPHLGEAEGYRDMTGCNVENFNYPVNLMFGSSMKIYEGTLETALKQMVKELNSEGEHRRA